MRYLIARVEEGTPIDQLRQLGPHEVIDSLAADLNENIEKAVTELAERERWDSDTISVAVIPLDDARRLSIGTRRRAEIRHETGPV